MSKPKHIKKTISEALYSLLKPTLDNQKEETKEPEKVKNE